MRTARPISEKRKSKKEDPPTALPFEWKHEIAHTYKCTVPGGRLYASEGGSWGVYLDGKERVSSTIQTSGEDLEDAKRRAQGAFMNSLT
jgi:hypothetical protein